MGKKRMGRGAGDNGGEGVAEQHDKSFMK